MAALIDIDHKREEILSLSTSMNVKPPMSTKLPFPALDERLANTLDMHHYAEVSNKLARSRHNMIPWRKSLSFRRAMTSQSFEELSVCTFDSSAYGELRRVVTSIIALYEKRSVARLFLVDMELDRSIGLTVSFNVMFRATELHVQIGMVYEATTIFLL